MVRFAGKMSRFHSYISQTVSVRCASTSWVKFSNSIFYLLYSDFSYEVCRLSDRLKLFTHPLFHWTCRNIEEITFNIPFGTSAEETFARKSSAVDMKIRHFLQILAKHTEIHGR